MLYKFKSNATGDLIMLEPNGRRVLEAIGKAPGPKGIILPVEMPVAIEALLAACAADEALAADEAAQARAQGRSADNRRVSLRQRATPFIDMLRRSGAAEREVVWGV